MAHRGEDWRPDDDDGERQTPLFGGAAGPRYFGTGDYVGGGSRYEGGYVQLEERDAPEGYGRFNFAGGYGSTDLYGGVGLDRPVRTRPRSAVGPRNYRRSDERIREDICEELMQQPQIDSRDVSVAVRDGQVELAGSVPDRRMKHAIEDLADACPGVCEVSNRIRVSRWPEDDAASDRGGDALEHPVSEVAPPRR